MALANVVGQIITSADDLRIARYAADISNIKNEIDAATSAEAPALLWAYLEGIVPGDAPANELQRGLVAALAIDGAFAALRIGTSIARGTSGPSVALRQVRAWYLVNGSCGKTVDALVLPADLPPAAKSFASGDSLLHCFANLRVIPRRLGRFEVRPELGIGKHFRSREIPTDLDVIRVAVAPLSETRGDAILRGFDDDGAPKVEVLLDAAQKDRLIGRARQVIRAAAREGAHILVLPEWTVPPDVARAIGMALEELEDSRASLLLIVAGTGATHALDPRSKQPYAECFVFGGRGSRVWVQRKMNHWTIQNGKTQELAGLPPHPDGRREHFQGGDEVVVADTPIGRCIVLICQDAEEDAPGRDLIRALKPRWVFVPVLDRSLMVGRWSAEKAQEIARMGESNVIVANSLLIEPPVGGSLSGIGWFVSRRAPHQFARLTVRSAASSPIVRLVKKPLERVVVGRRPRRPA